MYIQKTLIRGLADYRRNLVRNLGERGGDRTTIPKNEKSFSAVMGLNKVVSSQKKTFDQMGDGRWATTAQPTATDDARRTTPTLHPTPTTLDTITVKHARTTTHSLKTSSNINPPTHWVSV